MKLTNRQIIRSVFSLNSKLTTSQVTHRTKLDPKIVACNLSAMVLRTKELKYEKINGGAGTYRMININDGIPINKNKLSSISIKDIELKLAQLRNYRIRLISSGLTKANEIINDYEKLLSVFK